MGIASVEAEEAQNARDEGRAGADQGKREGVKAMADLLKEYEDLIPDLYLDIQRLRSELDKEREQRAGVFCRRVCMRLRGRRACRQHASSQHFCFGNAAACVHTSGMNLQSTGDFELELPVCVWWSCCVCLAVVV